jgi:hypothetical protein
MMTCVRPYDELVDIHKDEYYEQLKRLESGSIRVIPDPELIANDALDFMRGMPYRRYDETESLNAITQRYEDLVIPVGQTLTRLGSDSPFLQVMAELRSNGWKDWHLLTAVTNIVLNARAVERGINMTTTMSEADAERFWQLMDQAESPTDTAIPLHLFSAENMWFHLGNAARMTAANWGLDVRRNPLETRALLDVLGDRFHYWTDDVPHERLFDM